VGLRCPFRNICDLPAAPNQLLRTIASVIARSREVRRVATNTATSSGPKALRQPPRLRSAARHRAGPARAHMPRASHDD
jgi:hypothetical protein